MQCYSFTIGDLTQRTISAHLIAVSAVSYLSDRSGGICMERADSRPGSRSSISRVRSCDALGRAPRAADARTLRGGVRYCLRDAAQVFSGADRETHYRGARDEIVGNSAKMPTFVRLLAESTATNVETRGSEGKTSSQFFSNFSISRIPSMGSTKSQDAILDARSAPAGRGPGWPESQPGAAPGWTLPRSDNGPERSGGRAASAASNPTLSATSEKQKGPRAPFGFYGGSKRRGSRMSRTDYSVCMQETVRRRSPTALG